MISVKKDFNDIPAALLASTGGYLYDLDIRLYDKTKEEIPDLWKDSSILETLKNLYTNKCAYCETKTEHLEIDHYRPISKYPWLKNGWSNLLPVCPRCKAAKGENFPIQGKRIELAAHPEEHNRADSKRMLSEEPLLIHPEIDTAENHFYFEKNGTIQGFTERGRKTISTLDLYNPDLTKRRLHIYETFFSKLKEKIVSRTKNIPKHTELYSEILEAAQPTSEFSLLGIQICYKFEFFLYNEVFTDIEKNQFTIFADQIRGMSDEEYEGHPFFGMEAKDELETFNNLLHDIHTEPKLGSAQIPMSLVNFTVKNFLGIDELSVKNIPLNTQWIFLTGVNGYGKTSLLKAILLGLVGKDDFKNNEFDENARIQLTVQEHLMPNTNIFGSFLFSPIKKNIAAYGTKRIDFKPEATDIPVPYNLFEKTGDVLNTQFLLKTLDGNKELEPFKTIIIELFKALIPGLSRIEFVADASKTSKEILYFEKDENGNELPPVSFNDLATGMRSIIGMFGDMVQRLSKDKEFSENTNKYKFRIGPEQFSELKDLYGIVLIDEFDAHLHPKWQRLLVEKLTILFPKVQFIVSTHSEIPLLGAPKNSIILKVNRTKEEGITCEKLDVDISELPPENLLRDCYEITYLLFDS